MVRLRQAWHAIMALAQHTQSDYVRRKGIHRPWKAYMVMECYHRPWIEYTVGRRQE